MRYLFRWNEWNVQHIAEHGVTPEEAEHVVSQPSRGWPRRGPRRTIGARGRSAVGRYLQVIYILDPPGVVYVIHARDLTDREKRQGRRRER